MNDRIEIDSYNFRFQNVKVAWYFIGGFLAALLLAITTVMLCQANLLLMLLSIFSPMTAGIWIAIKKAKATDHIILSSKGFVSAFYGNVAYADIQSVSGPTIWVQAPIVLILKLRSGKKLIWALTLKNSLYNRKEDAETFNKFTAALSEKMELYYRANASKTPAVRTASSQSTNIAPENPARQLKKGITMPKAARTAIPLGSIILLLLALKNCGVDYIENKKDREVKAIFQSAETRYQNTVDHAKEVLDSMQKVSGPVFVYTNDSSVSVEIMPDINTDNAELLHDVPVLAHGAITDSLEKFMAYPDSFAYNMVLQTAGDRTLWVTKSVLNYNDSSDTWLYLACYEPDMPVTDKSKRSKNASSDNQQTFFFTTGIPVYNNRPLLKSMEDATLNLKMLLARTKFSAHYKVYLLALSRKDHIPESLFKEAVTTLNQQLAEIKADTAAFHFSIR